MSQTDFNHQGADRIRRRVFEKVLGPAPERPQDLSYLQSSGEPTSAFLPKVACKLVFHSPTAVMCGIAPAKGAVSSGCRFCQPHFKIVELNGAQIVAIAKNLSVPPRFLAIESNGNIRQETESYRFLI